MEIVTGDEKLIYFENPSPIYSYVSPGQPAKTVPKKNRFGKKVMLCVWWDMKGIIYWELLESGETINANRYSQQLRRLNEAIHEKRTGKGHGHRKVLLLHDNARPHVAIKTHNTILDLGWDVLPHPAYSPDLAPSDYYLFRSLAHHLKNQEFKSYDEVKNMLGNFFESKPESWYSDGIKELPTRWAKVISEDGHYFN